MKVLLVADAIGGVFTYAVELAGALAARGARVVLATEGAEPSPDQRRAVERAGALHEARAFRLEWMDDPWDDVDAAGRWLLSLEARERPDVVHTNEYAHGALPFRAPKVVVGHSCVVSWFEAVRGVPAPTAWDRYRAVLRAGLHAADAVVAPSAWMAAALVRHHGLERTPHVVPNGRDPARFRPAPKEHLVLGAGRVWDEAKNAAALARIAPRLLWPVIIAGEAQSPAPATPISAPFVDAAVHPERSADAAASARSRRIPTTPGAATFLGRIPEDELARWLGRAAIFAHPARYEPFGLAVLEAALSGCALVLGDIPSLRETWDGAAAFVPPRSDGALEEGVAALAADGARRRDLAARARARALGLTPARMADRYLALYRALGPGGMP